MCRAPNALRSGRVNLMLWSADFATSTCVVDAMGVCYTNVWAVNGSAFTKSFNSFTTYELGVAPEPVGIRIVSPVFRQSTVFFTLTPNMCDCRTSIGAGTNRPAVTEIRIDTWMDWIRRLPRQVDFISTLAVVRAWMPRDRVVPSGITEVAARRLTREHLVTLAEDAMLVVRFESPLERIPSYPSSG